MSGTPFSTVGLLYPGEMGAAVASLLRGRGVPVVTTLQGRSRCTARRAAECGAVVVASAAEVVRASDMVVSLVVPAAAEEVARRYAELAHLAPAGAVFVDANSVAPEKAAAMAEVVERTGRCFVDASINGLAKYLATSGTVYLSGARAEEVAALFEGGPRVRVLGERVGRASAMKMLLGGVSKGICALFAELAILAERQGMLDEMLEATATTYGGVAALAERMLPTYARHAGRRATEMNELEATARAAGHDPPVIEAVRAAHEALARALPHSNNNGSNGAAAGDLAASVRHLAARLKASDESGRPGESARVVRT